MTKVAGCIGLGGGMGVFLAQPITSALNEALATSAALSEVRRILELIVPLAYRPPIKVDLDRCNAAAVLDRACCISPTPCLWDLHEVMDVSQSLDI